MALAVLHSYLLLMKSLNKTETHICFIRNIRNVFFVSEGNLWAFDIYQLTYIKYYR